MSPGWRNNSFSVLSNDSGRFTENGDLHDFHGHTDRRRQNFGAFKSRFISSDQQRVQGIVVKGVFLQDLNPVTIDRCIDPVFSTCFNCWQYGHRYYECILPNDHKFCVNCGRMHVLIDSCPRCCHAYLRHVVYGLASINRQKSGPRIDNYHDGNNCYEKDGQDDTSQCRIHKNSSENNSTSFSGTSVSNSLEDLYYYSSSDLSENLIEDVIVDEDVRSCEPVSELVSDFLKLLVDMKAWSIEVQNTILLHFATERCQQTQ